MTINNQNNIIQKSIEVLQSGGTILYPTDTVWGIGCDATNPKAIKKVYSIKKRTTEKPLILLMNNADLLLNYVESVPQVAYKIINTASRPTTIIYNNPINLPNMLIHQNTIAIRVIQDSNLKELLNIFAKPITSTSANITGHQTPDKLENIDNEIKNAVDYIIPESFMNRPIASKASKLIKLSNNSKIEVIRN